MSRLQLKRHRENVTGRVTERPYAPKRSLLNRASLPSNVFLIHISFAVTEQTNPARRQKSNRPCRVIRALGRLNPTSTNNCCFNALVVVLAARRSCLKRHYLTGRRQGRLLRSHSGCSPWHLFNLFSNATLTTEIKTLRSLLKFLFLKIIVKFVEA